MTAVDQTKNESEKDEPLLGKIEATLSMLCNWKQS